MITPAILKAIMPFASFSNAATYAPLFDKYMMAYSINTRLRKASFLAQIAHESGSLRYTREIASGADYEGRKDLGNIQPGDGKRFRGRGLIQITGRHNYMVCSRHLFGDENYLIKYPERLEVPEHATHSACWFWSNRGLNELADNDSFTAITKRINGGFNGALERRLFYKKALSLIS